MQPEREMNNPVKMYCMQLRLARPSELMANFSPFLECNAGVSYRQDVLKGSE